MTETYSQLLDRICADTGADADVVEAVAASCGGWLIKLHDGDLEAATAFLQSEPLNAAGIALPSRIETIKKLRLAVHNKPDDFARLVLDVLTSEVAA